VRTKKTLAGLVMALPLALAGVSSATVCVDPDRTSCEPTIAAGVAAAGPGETVVVAEGTYRENVVVDRPGLVLRGSRGVLLDADDPNTGPGILVQAPGVVIEGLTVRHGNSHGISIDPGVAGTSIRGVRVNRPDEDCIHVGDGADATTIEDSLMVACRGYGVGAVGSVSGLVVMRSRFVRVGSSGVFLQDGDARVEKSRFEGGGCIRFDGDGVAIRNRMDQCGTAISARRGLLADKNKIGLAFYAVGVRCDDLDCPDAIIARNRLERGLSPAFRAATQGRVVLERNRVGSAFVGIQVDRAGDATIARNRIDDTIAEGVSVEGSNAILERNRVRNAAGDGIALDDGSVSAVEGNKALKGLRDGIDVREGAEATLRNNKAKKNRGVGVAVSFGGTATVEDNVAAGNTAADFCAAGPVQLGTNQFGSEMPPAAGDCPVD